MSYIPSLLSKRADSAFIPHCSWCLSPGRKRKGTPLLQIWLFSLSVFVLTHVWSIRLILHSPFRLDAKNRKDLGEASRTFKCARNCGILVWLLWLEEDPDSITMSHETQICIEKKHKKSKKEQLCTVSSKILGFQSMHKLNFSGLLVFGEFWMCFICDQSSSSNWLVIFT